jgi:hypothetical protein
MEESVDKIGNLSVEEREDILVDVTKIWRSAREAAFEGQGNFKGDGDPPVRGRASWPLSLSSLDRNAVIGAILRAIGIEARHAKSVIARLSAASHSSK